jgi:hypothetical protein
MPKECTVDTNRGLSGLTPERAETMREFLKTARAAQPEEIEELGGRVVTEHPSILERVRDLARRISQRKVMSDYSRDEELFRGCCDIIDDAIPLFSKQKMYLIALKSLKITFTYRRGFDKSGAQDILCYLVGRLESIISSS